MRCKCEVATLRSEDFDFKTKFARPVAKLVGIEIARHARDLTLMEAAMVNEYEVPDWAKWSEACAKFLRHSGKNSLNEQEALDCLIESGVSMDCDARYYRGLLHTTDDCDWSDAEYSLFPMETTHGFIFAVKDREGRFVVHR